MRWLSYLIKRVNYRCSVCFFFLGFLLTGCNTPNSCSSFQSWAQSNNKIRVLSTTAMIDDIVGRIGGDRIVHLPLITGEIDPHSYELVKGDDEKISLANLIFYNGLGLEHGASIRYHLQKHSRAIALGNEIMKQNPDRILHVGKEIDPHIWMDISLFSEIIRPILDALIEKDPAGKEIYEANALRCKEELMQVHRTIFFNLQAIPEEKRYLVTSHDAFNYFARAYLATKEEKTENTWSIRFEAPEGLAPDGQLSSSDIRKIVDHLMTYQITTVFPESNVSRDSLNKIVEVCRQKGLKVILSKEFLYADSMGSEHSFPYKAASYVEMLQHNANVLIQAWSD